MKRKQLYLLLSVIMNVKVKLNVPLLVGSGEVKTLDPADIVIFVIFKR